MNQFVAISTNCYPTFLNNVIIIVAFFQAERRYVLLKVVVAIERDAADKGDLHFAPMQDRNRLLSQLIHNDARADLALGDVDEGGDFALKLDRERLVELFP